MKVFVAHFNAECNEHISHIVNRDDFHFLYGDDCVKAMKVEDIFNKNDIEVIPSLYANTSPNGISKAKTNLIKVSMRGNLSPFSSNEIRAILTLVCLLNSLKLSPFCSRT